MKRSIKKAMKAIEVIKSQIEILKKDAETIDSQIETRIELFESRSEKWQLSDKGHDYELETARLEDLSGEIDIYATELSDAIESLEDIYL